MEGHDNGQATKPRLCVQAYIGARYLDLGAIDGEGQGQGATAQ